MSNTLQVRQGSSFPRSHYVSTFSFFSLLSSSLRVLFTAIDDDEVSYFVVVSISSSPLYPFTDVVITITQDAIDDDKQDISPSSVHQNFYFMSSNGRESVKIESALPRIQHHTDADTDTDTTLRFIVRQHSRDRCCSNVVYEAPTTIRSPHARRLTTSLVSVFAGRLFIFGSERKSNPNLQRIWSCYPSTRRPRFEREAFKKSLKVIRQDRKRNPSSSPTKTDYSLLPVSSPSPSRRRNITRQPTLYLGNGQKFIQRPRLVRPVGQIKGLHESRTGITGTRDAGNRDSK
ncbi:hypothetical protein F5880DRAFT_1619189 [Lentinula raphanica]|nr:hypothetical protein F5880DRAFT_1619189 [Lentinula raphanica]